MIEKEVNVVINPKQYEKTMMHIRKNYVKTESKWYDFGSIDSSYTFFDISRVTRDPALYVKKKKLFSFAVEQEII